MLTWKRVGLLLGAGMAFIAALVVAFHTGLPQRAQFTGRVEADGRTIAPELNAVAPSFALYTLDNRLIELADLRGAPVVVNFWATWCEPCRVEMPALQAVYQAYQDKGLRILAVNLGETHATAGAWAEQMGLTFDILLDPSQHIAALYQLRGQPSTYVIAPDGVITHVYYGPTSEAALRGALAPYFAA